jgi:hypothetical protein
MRMGVVAIMAKVIEFYVPDRLRGRRLGNPPEQHGKVIEFPSKITGVTSQFEGCQAAALVLSARKENDPWKRSISLGVSASPPQHSGENLGQGQLDAVHRVDDPEPLNAGGA